MSTINAAQIGLRSLKQTNASLTSNNEKIATGSRVNRASDDAAGLAVGEKLNAQISGLRRAERNIGDTISFTQTAEGHLNQVHHIIQRVREISVQAANGIYTADDRAIMQNEVNQLTDQINNVGSQAQFNTKNIFSGEFGKANSPLIAHLGANSNQNETISVEKMNANELNLANIDLSSPDAANQAIAMTDAAITQVSRQRAQLGASQNRLEYAAKGQMIAHENQIMAQSRNSDTDIIEEIMKMSINQVKQKMGMSMQAHRNINSKNILSLLGN